MTQKERTEFIVLQEDVKHIKSDISATKQSISNLDNTMTKLTSKLFNDDATGEMGMIEATRRNGVRLTKLENIKVAMFVIYGVVWGFVGFVIRSRW